MSILSAKLIPADNYNNTFKFKRMDDNLYLHFCLVRLRGKFIWPFIWLDGNIKEAQGEDLVTLDLVYPHPANPIPLPPRVYQCPFQRGIAALVLYCNFLLLMFVL